MHFRLAAASVFAFLATLNAAVAGDCSSGDVLGTSRVLTVDPAELKRLGTIQYSQSLPLEDHEVVLTFDDGPLPPNTDRVLDALAAECVKATFFVVGQMATAHPAALQRAYKEGHTIGTHSERHARLDRLSPDKGEKEISDGIVSAAKVLGDKSAVAPFFRFPYLDLNGAAEERAIQLGLNIWSADLHGSDWTFITAEKVTALTLSRLESKKKGVILLHDIHKRTAEALPVLLRELKKKGYRVVHVVPSAGAVAKIDVKPEEKTVANAAGKAEQAVASAEPTTAEKEKPGTADTKGQKADHSGGWQTRIKHLRTGNNVTAMSKTKKSALQSLIDSFWH